MMMMMIDVLRPLLCTRLNGPSDPQRRNNLQICPRRDSNTGGSDLWSNTLLIDHGGALLCGVMRGSLLEPLAFTTYLRSIRIVAERYGIYHRELYKIT